MEPPSFSLDSSLGRLACWLRLLGCDAACNKGDNLTVALARARSEGRILLTRSRDLQRLGLVGPLAGWRCIESDLLDEQLVEVARSFPIFERARPFTRCSRCNLSTQELPATEARCKVPPFVAKTQQRFQQCPSCRQIFWRATHSRAILQRLRKAAYHAGKSLGLTAEEENAGSGDPDPALPEG